MSVKLTAKLVEAFSGTFLSGRYDDAKPTPPFHRKSWQLYCSPSRQAGIVAPRGHAKSTALTYDYILAECLFRSSRYVILIGSTEDKAAEQLSNLSEEIETNEDMRREFGIACFETQQKTEIIVKFTDGARFRILARGAEQKIRGAMWNGMRPDLIVCDDMEDDEQVENKDRRAKFRRWFFRAAKQALSRRGRIRVHGTILHEDSLLSRLMKNKTWDFLFFKAHKSYSDFSDLLWPEQWSAEDLRRVQLEFEEDDDSAGYSQEFLNTPQDNNKGYLRDSDFIAMGEDDYEAPKKIYCGVDFAFSKKTTANHTSFTVGGVCVRNLIHHIDQHREHMDTLEVVEKFFEIDRRWEVEAFFVPAGKDWLAVKPVLDREMLRLNTPLIIVEIPDNSDKAVKGRVYQKKHKAGFCRYDTHADWYPAYKAELLAFTGVGEAKSDDQFDSTAILHRGIEMGVDIEEEDFVDEEEWAFRYESRNARAQGNGGRTVVGY